MKSLIPLIKYFLIICFFAKNINAEIVNDININGNKRISDATIKNIANFNVGKNYSDEALNVLQKKILESGFFETVKVKTANQKLFIEVKENPLIDFFYISGVKNKKRNELLYETLSLGENKIFSKKNLSLDILKIKEIFKEAGYFDVVVEPQVSIIENNLVNVILKIDRKNKYFIKRIYFNGNKYFSSSTLSDIVSSSEYGWWKFLSSSSTINTNRIEYDKFLIRKFYLENGFLDVQILSTDINIDEKQSQVNLIFSIDSGAKYNFNNFKLEDTSKNLNNKDMQFINDLVKKKINGVFSTKKLDFVKDKIINYFQANKIEFIKINTNYEKVGNDKVDLRFEIVSIPPLYINKIKVSGNTITDEKVIRDNLLFSDGDTYSKYKSNKAIDNLKSTRIFSDVKINEENLSADLIDLNINVEEQPTGSISAGVGAGSSGSSVSAGISEKNLFGKGIALFGDVSLGTEKISSDITATIPDYKNSGNTLGLNLYSISTDFKNAGYESSKFGSSTFLNYEVYEDISLKTGIGLEHDKIDVSKSASSLYKKREGNYSTLSTSYSVLSDKRNSKFLPTEGYRVGFGQKFGIPGSDISFLENNLFGNYYQTLSKDYVLSLKSGAKTINALKNNKDVKLSDRKFLTNRNLRGFENYGIGPKDNNDHVGGNYSAYASVSSTFPNPFPEKWNAKSVLFLDTGNVWGVDYDDNLDSNKLRSSFGVSLNWISPLGPVSFTLAEAISKADGDIEENFNFEIGTSF